MHRATIHAGFEYHLLGDKLYITSEADPDMQVALSPEAVEGLLSYLTQVGVICGRVEYVEKGLGGAHIYRLVLEDSKHADERASLGLLMYQGDAELTETMEYFQREVAEDRKD